MRADFAGYVTKANVVCTDGRTILPDAFAHQDKIQVPLVWQHDRKDPENILGHMILEKRPDGMYGYGFLNGTPKAQTMGMIVKHGDIDSMSIWANNLNESSRKEVKHGNIREVSLVIAGANEGAKIDFVNIQHDDGSREQLADEALINMALGLEHDVEVPEEKAAVEEPKDKEEPKDAPTYQEVLDSLSEEQSAAVHTLLGMALEQGEKNAVQHEEDPNGDKLSHSTKEGKDDMPRNVFEQNGLIKKADGTELSHADLEEFAGKVFAESKLNGQTFRSAFMAHSDDYGITNIEALFPDAKQIENTPEWITRRMDWVDPVINGARKLPFSRIKSMSADLTYDTARAKGYIKTHVKKEQFFAVASRVTTPKTIYKKQKLDRDDIIDITDFDVVAWLWVEIRFMLKEEVARAILIGDGREVDDEDKINEENIRPIAFDDPFYTDVIVVASSVTGNDLVEAVIRGRENYEGAGTPTAFMTRSVMNDMLLAKDRMGRRLYPAKADLVSALEVDSIINVPVMADVQTDDGELLMVLVNMSDYAIGSTSGGELTQFDDFDIDVNQYKYLLETRLSGALTKHKTAQVIVRTAGTEIVITNLVPTFVTATGVLTIPTVTGVTYKNADTDATISSGAQTAIAAGATVSVYAVANSGYYFPHNTDTDWDFTRDA